MIQKILYTRIISNLSQGYSRLPEGFHVPEKTVKDKEYFMNPQVEWTGGGMASTTEDLAKWAKLYYEGKLVNENSLEQITTPNENGNNVESTSSYGMGSFIYASKHGKAFGHTGFMPGFNSIFIYYPKLGIAAAININCDYAVGVLNLNELMDSLISISQYSEISFGSHELLHSKPLMYCEQHSAPVLCNQSLMHVCRS